MATMNVFTQDPFNTLELTDAINKVPYKPQFLGSLGIFEPRPIRTLVAAFEKKENVLSLVQTTPRGAPLEQRGNEKRDMRYFETVRIAKASRVRSDEIQSIRAFGSETELMQVQAEVMARMVALRDDIELTHENMRLGALQGIVTDADGSTLINWFNAWNISQPAEVDWDLDNSSPASGAVKKKCNETIRAMARAGKGAFVPGAEVIALCGDAFYDDLTAHPEVRATYLNQQEASALRGPYADVFDSFRYGGITFINYRGTDDGTTIAINTNQAKFFPRGARGVFQHLMSPGEPFDYVNTPGQPWYAMQIPDRDRNQHVDIEVYSYPLYVCTRPEMLLRARRT